MADYWADRMSRLIHPARLPFPILEEDSGAGSFQYVAGELLVDDDVAGSLGLAARAEFAPADTDQDWLDGAQLTLWTYAGPLRIPRVAAELRAESGSDRVAPHYVFSGEGKSTVPRGGPALPPAPRAVVAVPDDWGSGDPVVAVLDTGVALETRTGGHVAGVDRLVWDHTADLDPLHPLLPDGGWGDGLASQAGHGTFIASVIHRMAGGGARIAALRVLDTDGCGSEQSLVEGLKRLRTGPHGAPAIVNLSLGGFTDDGGWLPEAERNSLFPIEQRNRMPLGLEAELRWWRTDPLSETVFVCAAGNDGQDRPFWPAAAARPADPTVRPAVVSVASVRDASTGSSFSNRGDWVAVSTVGEEIVGDFPAGEMTDELGAGVSFPGGGAVWSGTSFSAPVISAELARRCRDDHRSGAGAWEDLARALAVEPSPGPGFGRLYDPVQRRGADPRT